MFLGRVSTEMQDFERMKEYFRWISIWVVPDTHRAMTLVVEKCLELENLALFTTSYGKYVQLEEFESVESHFCDTVRFNHTL